MKDKGNTDKFDCKSFEECGSCVLDMSYGEQKTYKINFIKEKFKEFYKDEIQFFASSEIFYRNRAEFGLFHQDNDIYYTMGGAFERRVFIDDCKKVDENIHFIMPVLIDLLKEDVEVKHKVFGVEFISTSDDLFIILLYHKDIELIKDGLINLQTKLRKYNDKISLIARSRGKKLVLGKECLTQNLQIKNFRFKYNFGYSAFIQPNTKMSQKMITWVIDNVSSQDRNDLLEMYCGYGNFTIPLSHMFDKVLATEISKESIKFANLNSQNNNIKNIEFARISSEELMQAFKGEEFFRLKDFDLDKFNFSHILVDPPRAGLDESVIEFIKNYKNIIYVSCNPDTLYENMKILYKTHTLSKLALFDQFPHTNHVECIALMSEKVFILNNK